MANELPPSALAEIEKVRKRVADLTESLRKRAELVEKAEKLKELAELTAAAKLARAEIVAMPRGPARDRAADLLNGALVEIDMMRPLLPVEKRPRHNFGC